MCWLTLICNLSRDGNRLQDPLSWVCPESYRSHNCSAVPETTLFKQGPRASLRCSMLCCSLCLQFIGPCGPESWIQAKPLHLCEVNMTKSMVNPTSLGWKKSAPPQCCNIVFECSLSKTVPSAAVSHFQSGHNSRCGDATAKPPDESKSAQPIMGSFVYTGHHRHPSNETSTFRNELRSPPLLLQNYSQPNNEPLTEKAKWGRSLLIDSN